jgi:hypothetical protein
MHLMLLVNSFVFMHDHFHAQLFLDLTYSWIFSFKFFLVQPDSLFGLIVGSYHAVILFSYSYFNLDS